MYHFFLFALYISLSSSQSLSSMDDFSPRSSPQKIAYHKIKNPSLSDSLSWSNSLGTSHSSSFSTSPTSYPTKKSKSKLKSLNGVNNPDTIYSNLMKAVLHNELKKFKEELDLYYKNPKVNLNQQNNNLGNNTLLHFAVLHRNDEIIEALIKEPNINSLILNQDGRLASDFLGEIEICQNRELLNIIKLRTLLDLVSRAIILFNYEELIDKNCSDKTILAKVEPFKENFSAIMPQYATNEFIVTMIRAHLKGDLFSIQTFLDIHDTNPNEQDELGNTFLHYATYLRDEKQIAQLLANPQVVSFIANKMKLTPHQLIPATEIKSSELRKMLFTRTSLESMIRSEIEPFLLQNPVNKKLNGKDKFVVSAIENVKRNYVEMGEAQKEDRALPAECVLSEYMDDTFILMLLQSRIIERKPNQPFFLNTIEQKDGFSGEITAVDSYESIYL
jgi:ankyrin repeat protein